MTKPINTQNEWIILTLIGAVAGFCLVSLDSLNVDWSSGWILSCLFLCEGKIHKPLP